MSVIGRRKAHDRSHRLRRSVSRLSEMMDCMALRNATRRSLRYRIMHAAAVLQRRPRIGGHRRTVVWTEMLAARFPGCNDGSNTT